MAGKYRRGRFLIPDRERLAIYDRDGWVCQLCGYDVDQDLPPSDAWAATLDHVEPQSAVLVPDHSPSNLRLAHRWCNSKRGAGAVSDADVRFQATLEVWRAMVEATVAYLSGPRTADRHEAFTQIINLTTDDLVAAI